jgi:HK97 family phage major capsid protein
MGTDVLIAKVQAELEERQAYIDHILESASNRDVNDSELESVTHATDRMAVLNEQLGRLMESAKIAGDSRQRIAEISSSLAIARNPAAARSTPIEYRSAGEYVVDRWRAGVGVEDAKERLGMYHRAAAHQTTADNLGIIPEPIVGSLVQFVDATRPVVSALGPLDVPGGRFNRPRVTQHTDVGLQTAEKAELVSRKMLIERVPVTMQTYGGYVNVSRQDIDWSVPQIMDLVIQDLGGEYAKETETVAVTALNAVATAGPTIPTGTPTGDAVAGAIWSAAGTAWTTTQGVGSVFLAVPPGMLGMLGPLFGQVNPQNQQGQGFSAASFGSGAVGTVAGVPVVMSVAVPANTMLLINTSAAEVYEQRIGSLQVTEPSVLGVQVAYAGYFAAVVVMAGGIVKITKTP